MLNRVTLTGADDTVYDPNEMFDLRQEFPFVEWGILIGSHPGSSRFPSADWITWLAEVKRVNAPTMRLSLHICGEPLRQVVAGNPQRLLELPELSYFERCQLNFHGEKQSPEADERIRNSFEQLRGKWNPEIIFRNDGENDDIWVPCQRAGFACSWLFDKSHGAGVSPGEWPSPLLALPCGYAGGLGPDNVVAELQAITAKACVPRTNLAVNFWIDMETKLFTDGVFDLTSCRSVLTQVGPFVEGYEPPRGGLRQINRGV